LLANNLNIAGAPAGGSANNILNMRGPATSYSAGGPIQSQLGPAGAITQSYGPADNFSADRQRVEDALMARMNPQLQIQKQGVEQQLADQGIRYGSQAYADAMDNYNRSANDARWGAISQAGQEQQRMTQEAASQAAFQNAAQEQGYQQQLGAGQFLNQAQQQQYNQNAALASFGNAGLAQQLQQQQAGFNAAQSARNQWMQEQYAQRNQPINEITSLLSGSQVNQPNFINTPGAQIPTTDIAGLLNQNFNQQLGIYQQQNQNVNSLVGGVLGLGAGALKASDRRMKKDVRRMATVFAAGDDETAHKLPIYQYAYKDDPTSTRHIGPMAQDVEKIDPRAVETIKGRKYIDTHRVMGSILRAA
jgi:Chaperone of endosialidase